VPEFLHLFERVVRERGDAPAVVARDATLSFSALRAAAVGLAEQLAAAGVVEGDVVGLSVGRSSLHVVGMLGTWYAGAAFLPLDESAPEERVAAMLHESRARAVVATDGRAEIVLRASRSAPLGSAGDDLAYVIYTSGSTGRPKGVRVSHRGLCAMLLAQIVAFGLGPGKRALFSLSTAFDASISDIGTALLSGATLVVAEGVPSPTTLAERLRSDAITHADLPPSLLPLVDPGTLAPCLETVVIGGEVCPPGAVRAWARRVRVVNVYGPTEATICTSLCACDAELWSRPLIGNPLPHVEYAVDDGELLIAGPALALGYVDRPDLEARRFVEREARRWYRTGDRVRRLADGSLEFVGRLDRQVKLRGRLVCPEEIEAPLRSVDGVADAVVEAREDGGPVVLVAWVVPKDGASLTVRSLRERLEKALPGWMIPRIALADAVARGASGKVHLTSTARRHRVITDPRVRVVVEAFEEVLHAESVGEDDDLVALGGDSLAALEIAAEAQLSGVGIEAETVLASRTPAAIAAASPAGPRSFRALDEIAERLATDLAGESPTASRGNEWLVTGVTGFLGSRLVPQLIARTGGPVHCIVRAATDAEARARLGELGASPRVVAYAGDVSAPRLGLQEATWRELTLRVGHVVHAAASLSLTLPFQALEATNVRGALEVARFARAGGSKTVHHVSSLSVLASTDLPTTRLDEETPVSPEARVFGAYAQTKWLSETVLRRTVPDLRIVRPGLLTGDSRTAVSSPTCPLASFLRAVVALRGVPVAADDELRVDVTPIDVAARAIAEVVTTASCPPLVHVASEAGASLADLLRALGRHVTIERVSPHEFLHRARRGLSRESAIALVTSSFRLLGADAQRAADLFLHTGRTFPCRPLERILGRRADWLDEGLLSRYATKAYEAEA
jgi:amino acid adenylation domain-containing protein/thioester reductase-like protein